VNIFPVSQSLLLTLLRSIIIKTTTTLIWLLHIWLITIGHPLLADEAMPEIILVLEMGEVKLLGDDQITRELSAVLKPSYSDMEESIPKEKLIIDELEIIWSSQPLFRENEITPKIYRATLDNPTVLFISRGPTRIIVQARAKAKNKTYFAQTSFRFFGRGSGGIDGPGEEANPPIWPQIRISGDGGYHRTGDNINADLIIPKVVKNEDEKNEVVIDAAELENNVLVAEQALDDQYLWMVESPDKRPVKSKRSFTLSLDHKLASRGYNASKEIHFFANLPSGGSISFSEAVYRSNSARKNYFVGIFLIIAFMCAGRFYGNRCAAGNGSRTEIQK
jgi:hypothetical protein